VAKGSAVNKCILVPAALLLSAFAPWAITPVLLLGGTFLCFEGMEKVAHKFLHPESEAEAEQKIHEALKDPSVDMKTLERQKIKGAIRTDFILSAEIIVITLGAVATASLVTQIGTLVTIAALMTVGVYGVVAAIIKMDDLGLALTRRPRAFTRRVGRWILAFAPEFMKFLSIAGTIAMFLVGGGIVVHGIPALHHLQETIEAAVGGGLVGTLAGTLFAGLIGVVLGALVVAIIEGGRKLFGKGKPAAEH
jgi:predicted DNA repair protein MutK